MALSVAREGSADIRFPEHREATDLSHRSRQAHNNTRNLSTKLEFINKGTKMVDERVLPFGKGMSADVNTSPAVELSNSGTKSQEISKRGRSDKLLLSSRVENGVAGRVGAYASNGTAITTSVNTLFDFICEHDKDRILTTISGLTV